MMTASSRALARIHAVAAEYDISHEMLHAWAEYKHFDSLKDVPDDRLDQLADWLDKPGEAQRFRETFCYVNAPSLLFTDDEWAALHEAADRDEAARRARQETYR
jgi:hypothetical protein